LKNYFIEVLEPKYNREIPSEKMMSSKLINIMKLFNLRSRLNLIARSNPAVFKNILVNAKKLVSGWGGSLYFVYIPSISEINNKHHPFRKVLLSTVTELDIPIIDIQREVLDLHPDPLSLFPFRNSGHYNAEGYQFIAKVIEDRLKKDGINPLNSKN
jgi:lysophospholipase L1-like esterase